MARFCGLPHSVTQVSAYVSCYNAAATIRRTVESLLGQTIKPAEVIVVDDGSTDGSIDAIRGLDVRVVTHPSNLGRGEARARAMRESRHQFVVCCDATNTLEPAFVEKALPWFENQRVAAVFGRITQPHARNVAERWRGRHLFKLDLVQESRHGASLCTWGTLMRASAATAVGGYDTRLRHCEDVDLGARLLRGGFDVVFDPLLETTAIGSNTPAQVLERYWRWNATGGTLTWYQYLQQVAHSVRVLARKDLAANDPAAVPISLAAPHYQAWKTWTQERPRA
jgi:glycosyltransferase involved in cell wall biosynthesis